MSLAFAGRFFTTRATREEGISCIFTDIPPLFGGGVGFISQCHIFLPFHMVHGVLKAGILKRFAIPFSSGPCFVRTLHHDLSILGDPTQHGS